MQCESCKPATHPVPAPARAAVSSGSLTHLRGPLPATWGVQAGPTSHRASVRAPASDPPPPSPGRPSPKGNVAVPTGSDAADLKPFSAPSLDPAAGVVLLSDPRATPCLLCSATAAVSSSAESLFPLPNLAASPPPLPVSRDLWGVAGTSALQSGTSSRLSEPRAAPLGEAAPPDHARSGWAFEPGSTVSGPCRDPPPLAAPGTGAVEEGPPAPTVQPPAEGRCSGLGAACRCDPLGKGLCGAASRPLAASRALEAAALTGPVAACMCGGAAAAPGLAGLEWPTWVA